MKDFKINTIGVPLNEVGNRLLELHNAIEQHGMGISADAQYNLEFLEGHDDVVKCAKMTVYFFQKK